jgi:tRNA-binding protein
MLTWRLVITAEEFSRLEMRVGRILTADDFTPARKPSCKLKIDFGELGVRSSIAALRRDYEIEELVGRQVVCVVNLPPRRIAGFDSQVLVLAAVEPSGRLRILSPESEAELGSRIA